MLYRYFIWWINDSAVGFLMTVYFSMMLNVGENDNNNYYRNEYNEIYTHADVHALKISRYLNIINSNVIYKLFY